MDHFAVSPARVLLVAILNKIVELLALHHLLAIYQTPSRMCSAAMATQLLAHFEHSWAERTMEKSIASSIHCILSFSFINFGSLFSAESYLVRNVVLVSVLIFFLVINRLVSFLFPQRA